MLLVITFAPAHMPTRTREELGCSSLCVGVN